MLNLAHPEVVQGQDMLARIPSLTRTCSALRQAGVEIMALQRFTRDEDIEFDGVQYVLRRDGTSSGSVHPWTSIRSLLAFAQAWKPDILHVNGLIFPAQVAQARALLGRDAGIFVQHHGELPSSRKLRALQTLCLRFADAFIFNGAGNADPWRAAGIIRPHQPVFEAVEGSCDFAPLTVNEARACTGVHGHPAILWVGRLHPRKDPLTALEGFASCIAQLSGAQLYMIYGEDLLLPEIKSRLAQQPELAQRVHLIGKMAHETLPAWYSAADLFLTSSPAEGSNYALIESMSCGNLPVCSDIPPHRFIVGDHGMRWPVGDAGACAHALVAAHDHRNQQTRSNVRRWFDTHLNWPAIGRQLQAAYQSLPGLPPHS